jgi:hypothetical protein
MASFFSSSSILSILFSFSWIVAVSVVFEFLFRLTILCHHRFELATEENWPNIMYQFVDASPSGPETDFNTWRAIFFVGCVFITSLFVKDCVVGTLVESYNSKYAELVGKSDLNANQQSWLELYKEMVDTAPENSHRPPHVRWWWKTDLRIRQALFSFWNDKRFDYAMFAVMVVNGILLCSSYYQQSPKVTDTIETITNIIIIVFLAEMLMKWLTVGLREYFSIPWNVFDALLNLFGILDFVSQFSGLAFNPKMFRIIRNMRLVRFFRIYPRLLNKIRTLLYVPRFFLLCSLSFSFFPSSHGFVHLP